jgi:hypothetical protein
MQSSLPAEKQHFGMWVVVVKEWFEVEKSTDLRGTELRARCDVARR